MDLGHGSRRGILIDSRATIDPANVLAADIEAEFPDTTNLTRRSKVRTARVRVAPSRRSVRLECSYSANRGTFVTVVDRGWLFGLWRIVLQQFLYGLCQIFLLFLGFGFGIESLARYAPPREILVRGVVHV